MYVEPGIFSKQQHLDFINDLAISINNALSPEELICICNGIIDLLNKHKLVSDHGVLMSRVERAAELNSATITLSNLMYRFNLFDLSLEVAYVENTQVGSPVAFWSGEGRAKAEAEDCLTLGALVVGKIFENMHGALENLLDGTSSYEKWSYIKPMWIYASEMLGAVSVVHGREISKMPVAYVPSGVGESVATIFAQHELKTISERCSQSEFDQLIVYQHNADKQWVGCCVSESGSFPRDLADIPKDNRQVFLKAGLRYGIFVRSGSNNLLGRANSTTYHTRDDDLSDIAKHVPIKLNRTISVSC